MNKKSNTIKKIIGLGKADYHIHSNFSDGKPSVEEILEYCENKTDLDVIAISDHNTIEGAILAHKIASEKKYRFEVIIGEEISTKEGHIIGLFLSQKIEAGLSAKETIQAIRKQGGISIASHPFQHTKFSNHQMITMDGIGSKILFDLRFDLNAVETVNATPTLADENLGATTINRTLIRIAEVGGSDAHILEAIGMGYTVFEGKTTEEFKKSIINNQTQAIFNHWSISALLKYLYFFIPVGLRMVWNYLFGRKNYKKIN